MSSDRNFVIVGGGLAGAKTAEALRELDFPGSVVLLSEEEHLPYERPPLSKEHLAGKKPLAEFTVHNGDWYRDHHIDLRLGTRAEAIDREARTVSLPDGSTIPYDKLALATGSRANRPPIPGSDAEGVRYLRTIEESDELVDGLGPDTSIAIIGAGWIGLEVGASARGRGADVTIVESAELPLLGSLGPEMGQVFADLHRDNGVKLHLGATVEAISADNGRASGVRLADGTTISADLVLVAVGATPNVELATATGLDVDGGVLVDSSLRTSDPDIVAIGDIASHQHPAIGSRVRVEHWANALNQPAVAAASMLDRSAEYTNLPYFFTDQYDLGMEYTGYVPAGGYDRVVVRGDSSTREFLAFWLAKDNTVLAGMNVNIWDVTDQIKALVASKSSVDPNRLADTSVELSTLAP